MFQLRFILLIMIVTCSYAGRGQSWPEVRRITDSTEYYEMLPMVDSCLSYLRNTMPEDDPAGRSEAVNFLDDWITGVPFITIFQLEYLFDVTDKNEELITQHVAGKIHLWRNDSSVHFNSYQSELAGLLWMIELYKDGSFVANREMDYLVELHKSGELPNWLKRKLPSSWKEDI